MHIESIFQAALQTFFPFSCQVAGFLEKNRDGLRPDLEDLIARSGNQVNNTVQVLVSKATLILLWHGSETQTLVPNK